MESKAGGEPLRLGLDGAVRAVKKAELREARALAELAGARIDLQKARTAVAELLGLKRKGAPRAESARPPLPPRALRRAIIQAVSENNGQGRMILVEIVRAMDGITSSYKSVSNTIVNMGKTGQLAEIDGLYYLP
jgi:hypothetical protein